MNNRKWIFAGLIGLVFVFAGYNLYSYFSQQQAIQIEEDRLAQERRAERERDRAERDAAHATEQQRLSEERQARAAAQAQEEADRQAQRDQERLEAEANARIAREAREQAQREADQAGLEERIARARSREMIEDFNQDGIDYVRTVSPRYLEANPAEALQVYAVQENEGRRSTGFGRRILFQDQTTFLMVVAAVSQNSDVIDSIIGLGADINAANKMGFTPLMFAAAYNTPEMVQYILNQGADPLVISLTGDVNTLHIAAYLNPNPDIIDVLIDAGLAIEEPMLNGDTALLLASEENTNIEVVERLVEFGADVSVFNADGVTPLGFITQRLGNRGKRFNEISDEMNERVLQSLALTEAAQ
jgi:hypothetical protein